MSDEATTRPEADTAGADGHGPTDKSPREANKEEAPQRAEVSNFEIVNHWFTLAADRLEIAEDVRAVLSSSYREVQVQIPVSPERRQDACLLRLPRPAQRRARPVQGRHPLPPRGRPRRGARARVPDDLEDGDRRRSLRRREGRRQLQPARADAGRGREDRPLVHGQDREGARPDARHPGARRRDERADDGLAHGRVREAARPHAGDRHRQADRARGLIRPRGRHRPRRRLHARGGREGGGREARTARGLSSRATATSARGRRGWRASWAAS